MSGSHRERTVIPIATACFFLSGVAALVYEVVWTRLLGLVFGHTVFAITTVLATYMGGLALGSVLVGRRADSARRPLRLYGVLEGAVGLYVLATPLLFRAADAAYLWAHRAVQPSAAGAAALHLVISAALLLPPTTLMGATLPVLARALVRDRSVAVRLVGTLYAVNTWGAVAGTALSGFFLIPALGVRITTWGGAALNLVVAAMALALDATSSRRPAVVPPEEPVAPDGAGPLPRHRAAVALLAIGLSGAASMAYEIAWTRALSLVLGSSTYAFTAMLTTFLVGLALGALVVARGARRWRPGLVEFGATEIAIGFAVVLTLPVIGRLPDAVIAVLRQVGVSTGTVLATQFGLSFAVMIVPTLLIGATFPLVLAALHGGLERVGRDVGNVYAANTLGTIAGSIATGFVLIRWIGIQSTVLLAAGANLLAGVAVVLVASARGRAVRALAFGAPLAFVALAVAVPHWDPKVMTSGAAVYAEMFVRAGADALRNLSEGRELLFYDEGISTTVAVVRDPGGTTLTVNGKGDASNDTDMPTQLLVGHLGPLLQPDVRRALVIGLASGVTAGALVQHPLEAIDVAELEPAMRTASSFFVNENRNVLADPRVRILDGDGRSILATAPRPYDLIVSEPSNPWIAGVASLFTLDFYRAARERLAPRGVMVQWLQNYSIFTRDMRMVVRTFQQVFPHVSIWAASPNDFVLVATPEPLALDAADVASRVASSPGAKDDFDRFRWHGENLVFRFFLGEEDARRYAEGAPLNTDDLPLLEFSAPLALYGASAAANEEGMRSFRTVERPPVSHLDARRFTGPEGHLRAAFENWIVGHEGEARHQLARAGPPEPLAPELRALRGRLLFMLGDLVGALKDLTVAVRASPRDAVAARYEKATRTALDPDVARRLASAPGSLRSGIADVFLSLARARRDADLYGVALDALDAETRLHPGSYEAANNLAGVLYELGRFEETVPELRRAIALNPSLAATHFNLALALEKLGQPREALRHYEETIRLDPGWTKARDHITAIRRSGS